MKRFLAPLVGLLLLAAPAKAATIPAASFAPGNTVGLGYSGLSFDHGFGSWSLGASVGDGSLFGYQSHMRLSARVLGRFFDQGGLDAGWLGGLMYDPGVAGDRAYLVPDVGIGVAYTFAARWPVTLWANLTLTVNQVVSDPTNPVPTGNLLQRLTLGPESTVGLGLHVTPNLELTLGGGTLAGFRLTD
ncbi:MAG TPA: hypothetical protein V6D47_20000 [Oscillatoriaceae cyanobacterium]